MTVPLSTTRQRHAVIDIGTNSVKILVGDVDNQDGVLPLHEVGQQTRLGRGFYETQELQPGPIADTTNVVTEFVAEARRWGCQSIRLIATSAVREAKNGSELRQALELACALPLEIIDGDQEADWGFQGVLTNQRLAAKPLMVLDVGGGSTECVLGSHRVPEYRSSFELGSVRLLESLRLPDAPTPTDLKHARDTVAAFYQNQMDPRLTDEIQRVHPACLVGIGGTTAILARIHLESEEFDREAIENITFAPDTLSVLVEKLWRLPLVERRELPGLPPERADVILTGSVIYEQLMVGTGSSELTISTRGMRFAVLMDSAERFLMMPDASAKPRETHPPIP